MSGEIEVIELTCLECGVKYKISFDARGHCVGNSSMCDNCCIELRSNGNGNKIIKGKVEKELAIREMCRDYRPGWAITTYEEYCAGRRIRYEEANEGDVLCHLY